LNERNDSLVVPQQRNHIVDERFGSLPFWSDACSTVLESKKARKTRRQFESEVDDEKPEERQRTDLLDHSRITELLRLKEIHTALGHAEMQRELSNETTKGRARQFWAQVSISSRGEDGRRRNVPSPSSPDTEAS